MKMNKSWYIPTAPDSIIIAFGGCGAAPMLSIAASVHHDAQSRTCAAQC